MKRLFPWLSALWLALAPLAATAQDATPSRAQPETGTGWQDKSPVIAERQMVVAAHPLAAETARDILRQGGSAMDAAIAAQFVLNLVEPQSSGLGGGGFIVHWDAEANDLRSY